MKKILFAVSILTVGFLASCGGEEKPENKEESKEETLDLDGYEGLNLADYDVNITIMVPTKETALGTLKPKIEHEDGGFQWDISIGPNFAMTIEDFGSEDKLVARKKERLTEKEFYHIEYLKEEGNVMLYKRMLKYDGKVEESDKKNVYFVFGEFQIGNVNYIVKSTEDGLFKPEAEEMLNAIKSIKVNE